MIDIASGINAVMEAELNSTITSAILDITDKSPRSIDDFIRDHRAAFERQASTFAS